ncbi:MAG: hypothetical protein P9M06_02260 [Candidatus Saelkia tenebricola]|nr:hypothetical protein [Candidatus Saelkia tenebricola]
MEDYKECVICRNDWSMNIEEQGVLNNAILFKCPICHAFRTTDEFLMWFPREKFEADIWKIQGALREIRRKKKKMITLFYGESPVKGVNDYTIDELIESVEIPETPTAKIEKFLQTYEDSIGGTLLSVSTIQDYPEAYAANLEEFLWILETANELGFFSHFSKKSQGPSQEGQKSSHRVEFQLSAKAWGHLASLKQKNIDSKKIFVACWFNDTHDTYRKVIEDSISNVGYDPMSIKERHYPETIISKALGEIQQSRLVIVDLTEQRHTVFVEWGFALGKNIPCLLVVSKEYWDGAHSSGDEQTEKLEFYAKNYSIKIYKNEEHLKEIVESAVREIL